MCFSATADLVAGTVIAVVGVDAVRHIRMPEQVSLGLLPLLLAGHQLTEAVVWWGLQGHVSRLALGLATSLYLLFAFVVLPVYLPVSVLLVESDARRRRAMSALIIVGVAAAASLWVVLVTRPVSVELCPFHISYGGDLWLGSLVVPAYVVATCGAALLSSSKYLRIFGVLDLAAVAALVFLERDGFASLWCGWAALVSIVIVLQLRKDDSRQMWGNPSLPSVHESPPTFLSSQHSVWAMRLRHVW